MEDCPTADGAKTPSPMSARRGNLSQRLREYYQNPHHINPLSEAMMRLLAEVIDHLSVEASYEGTCIRQQHTIDQLRDIVNGMRGPLKNSFITCVSGDGQPYVKASFSTLQEAQSFHASIVHSPLTPYGSALIGQGKGD